MTAKTLDSRTNASKYWPQRIGLQDLKTLRQWLDDLLDLLPLSDFTRKKLKSVKDGGDFCGLSHSYLKYTNSLAFRKLVSLCSRPFWPVNIFLQSSPALSHEDFTWNHFSKPVQSSKMRQFHEIFHKPLLKTSSCLWSSKNGSISRNFPQDFAQNFVDPSVL